MANPRAFSNSNPAPLGNPLFYDRYREVLVCVVVVHDQHLLCNVDISAHLYKVPRRHDAAGCDDTIVSKHDGWLALNFLSRNIKPSMVANSYVFTYAYSLRSLATDLTGEMKRRIGTDRREWIRQMQPDTVELS